jgi:hypothetical protein
MAESPEVEITFSRRGDGFVADVRYSNFVTDDMDVRHAESLPLNLGTLRKLMLQPDEYGKELGRLLDVPEIRETLIAARGAARDGIVRIRIATALGDSDLLHGIRWELIRDSQGPLASRADIALSRFLPSMRWLQTRPSSRLSILAAVADPTNLGSYADNGIQLAPIDREKELELIRNAVGKTAKLTELEGPCTLRQLMIQLSKGFDVLYLVCHGALIAPSQNDDAPRSPEPQLWLQDDTGQSSVTDGRSFASRLRDLHRPPRLVVLASCQSAGKAGVVSIGRGGVLTALGPRLIEAGVPAVVAMQGDVEVETIHEFFPAFFDAVGRHGGVDLAMSEARALTRGRTDWWVPALFMRLRSGRIWYRAGFSTPAHDWDAVVSAIRNGDCTPVLGPDVCESLIGSQREIASAIATHKNLPLSEDLSDDLAHVMQFLTVRGERVAQRTLVATKIEILLSRFKDDLDPALVSLPYKEMDLEELEQRYAALLDAAWRLQRATGNDPYTLLAQLKCRRFITADSTPLLEQALVEAGKEPEIVFCPWREELRQIPSVYDKEQFFRGTTQRPLVYYVRGRDDKPASLVTTEDDYFSFMTGVGESRALVPTTVTRALSDASVMFLGFAIDNWAFRALFRTLMNQEGSKLRGGYRHVAVQIDLEEGRFQDPLVARRYLVESFQNANIDLYWGRVQEFMSELESHVGAPEVAVP